MLHKNVALQQDRQVYHVEDFCTMNWHELRQLTTTDDFYIFSLIWLRKWRPHKDSCDDPNDKVTTLTTTLEDLLTTQLTAHEDFLTTQVTAHDDLLTTLHEDTDDLLDDIDKQW